MDDEKVFSIERLYDYSKFHIGLYTSIVGGLLAFLNLRQGMIDQVGVLQVVLTVCLFLAAGAFGGIVCVNCIFHRAHTDQIKHDHKVRLWGVKLPLTIGRAADLEHACFWIGLVVLLLSMLAAGSSPGE
ncbi:MAG: hypothetical protein AAGI89_13960 [Pseudomonadota bacterium]